MKRKFIAYGYFKRGKYHVFLRSLFREVIDDLNIIKSEVLLISPEPTKKIKEEITDYVTGGVWIDDIKWSKKL